MNHYRHYKNLITKAQKRGTGVESHHIFPRAIFGDNDKVVMLTMREHYVAHLLLYHICLKRYNRHPYTYKMALACEMMGNRTSRHYESTRRYFVDNHHTKTDEGRLINSLSKRGEKNGMYGKPAANRGISPTPEVTEANRQAHQRRYKVTYNTGESSVIIGMKQFAIAGGHNPSHLIQISKGKRKRHHNIVGVERLD